MNSKERIYVEMKKLVVLSFLLLWTACSSRPSQADLRKVLEEQVNTSYVKIDSFRSFRVSIDEFAIAEKGKTGKDAYTVEFDAVITFLKDPWKGTALPDRALMIPLDQDHRVAGDRVSLKGIIVFVKSTNGWTANPTSLYLLDASSLNAEPLAKDLLRCMTKHDLACLKSLMVSASDLETYMLHSGENFEAVGILQRINEKVETSFDAANSTATASDKQIDWRNIIVESIQGGNKEPWRLQGISILFRSGGNLYCLGSGEVLRVAPETFKLANVKHGLSLEWVMAAPKTEVWDRRQFACAH